MEQTYVIKYTVQKEDDCYLLRATNLVPVTIDEEGNVTIEGQLEFANNLASNPSLEEVYIETVTIDEIKDAISIDTDDEEEIKKAFIENVLKTHYYIAKEKDGKIFTQQVEMESPIKQLVGDYLTLPGDGEDISEEGLEAFLNERFIGYEEQNRQLARILFNNLELSEKEDNETILMIGNNTKTISIILRYAAKYLGLPYKRIGIDRIDPGARVGASTIENEIMDTIKEASNAEVAHLAIVAIDGISEIGNASYGSRRLIIDDLRRFVEGETIYYSTPTGDIPFDTSYLSKVFIGSFEGYPHTSKEILGFIKEIDEVTGDTIMDRISRFPSTDQNLLSSMDNLIVYNELSIEDKKRYLLTSKLSVLVRKEIEMQENYQVELAGQEVYVNALVECLFEKYSRIEKTPSIEDINREVRRLLHIIIRDLKDLGESEDYDTVVLDEDTVYKGTYQLLSKQKGMLN